MAVRPCGTDEGGTGPSIIRVMTWNVHGLRGRDGRRDPERIAEVIRSCAPDVAGLQEVGAPAQPGGPERAADLLAALTGLHLAFGPTLAPAHGFAYGNAVLSRTPIEAVRTYDLSVPGREPRCCIRADVAFPGARVHVFSAHLGLHWRERRKQAAQLLSSDILRDAALAYPLVLAGDFNSLGRRSAVPRWLRRALTDCALAAGNGGPTFPARFPLLRLDHVYASSTLTVRDAQVVRTPLARIASDHLPVLVELELSPEARVAPPPRAVEVPGVRTSELRTSAASEGQGRGALLPGSAPPRRSLASGTGIFV